MNVEQRVEALQALLEKVQTNAAQPRPERSGSPLLAAAPAAGDDVVGQAVPAIAAATAAPKAPEAEDLWKEPQKPTGITPKTPPTAAVTTPKPAVPGLAKPALPVLTKPGVAAAKPVVATPTAAKAAVGAPTAAKPVIATPTAAKPAIPATTPKPAAALPKLGTPAAKPAVAAVKPAEELKKTLQGVGDGEDETRESRPPAVQDIDAVTAPIGLAPDQIEALLGGKEPEPAKKPAIETGKPKLPSAIVEGEGDDEPTQLHDPMAASRRAEEMALAAQKAEAEAKAAAEKKAAEAKAAAEKAEAEAKAAAEKKAAEAKAAEEKAEAEKKAAAAKAAEVVDIDVEAAPAKKPDAEVMSEKPTIEMTTAEKPGSEAVELELDEPADKPEPVAVKPPPPPLKVVEAKPEELVPVPTKTAKPPVKVAPPEPAKEPAEEPKKGLPAWVLLVAVAILIGAGVFVAMKQGWIGGAKPDGTGTGGTVAPPATTTAAEVKPPTPPTPDTVVAPPASAVAAPPDSAAPAASASAAPAASEAAPTAPPAKDPATLPATRAMLTVTSGKQAIIFLTGKLVGNTGELLEVDCGPKFLRLAEPGETNPAKAKWLTPGISKVIACQKMNDIKLEAL